MPPRFRDIKFGYASAEEETRLDPDLLLLGFLDLKEVIREARDGTKFLFLGYKGSGKSSVGQYFALLSKREDESLSARTIFLKNFSFQSFDRLAGSGEARESRYPTVWLWILSLALVNSFDQSNGISQSEGNGLSIATNVLTSRRFLPLADLDSAVLLSSQVDLLRSLARELVPSLPHEIDDPPSLLKLMVNHLLEKLVAFTSPVRHLLIVDGIDDVLTGTELQYSALAALVLAVQELNSRFITHRTPAKVLVLCRTDIYERLPAPNKNKLRQDSSFELDWYETPANPGDCLLIKMANLKAGLTVPEVDIFAEYLPRTIRTTRERDTRDLFLEHTRYTPRDLIELLSYVQRASRGFPPRLSPQEVFNGLRNYASRYFIGEIRDELVARLAGPSSVQDAMNLIGMMRNRDFTLADMRRIAKTQPRLSQLDLTQLLTLLFESSAIGNLWETDKGNRIHHFRYKNHNANINLGERFIMHSALWKAISP